MQPLLAGLLNRCCHWLLCQGSACCLICRSCFITLPPIFRHALQVAADQQTAVVQGGSRFGQLYFDVNNQTNGAKAAVGGTCPPVGAGALLGGGLGFLTRQHGLGCDSFISARMVGGRDRPELTIIGPLPCCWLVMRASCMGCGAWGRVRATNGSTAPLGGTWLQAAFAYTIP